MSGGLRRRTGLLAVVAVGALVAFLVGVPLANRSSDAVPASRVLWGIGDQLDAATESGLYQDESANMVTAWYNGPDDLAWMQGYAQPSTISDLYGDGKAVELVVFLADHPDYAVGDQFQDDVRLLVRAMKGSGPNYGPLYVVLFTEWETYSPDPEYEGELKRAYLGAVRAIHEEYAGARVALGFGGYEWSESPTRDLSQWSDAIAASDFVAVQAMQDCRSEVDGVNILVNQVRTSVQQLGSYRKPVMISHFKLWGDPACQVEAFRKFAAEVLNDRSLTGLVDHGLFAWGFMGDHYITDIESSGDPIRQLLHEHAGPAVSR